MVERHDVHPAPDEPALGGRPASYDAIRRFLAGLSAGYLLAVFLCLPVARTRDALETRLLGNPAPAARFERVLKGGPVGNPEDDFSDAIRVAGIVVFRSPVTRFDVPREAPKAPAAGKADRSRAKLVCIPADFGRGPPPLA